MPILSLIQRSLFAAATAVLCLAPAAQAAIVSVSFAAAPVLVPNDIDGVYFNFLTGEQSTREPSGYDFNPYNNHGGLTYYGAGGTAGIMSTTFPGSLAQATPLRRGDLISSAAQFTPYQTQGNAFNVTGQEYVGVRFYNEDTGIDNYAWVLMSTTANTAPNGGFAAAVLGYGYDDAGLSILAGQTADGMDLPEPASLAVFGLGLAALAGVRGRRRQV